MGLISWLCREKDSKPEPNWAIDYWSDGDLHKVYCHAEDGVDLASQIEAIVRPYRKFPEQYRAFDAYCYSFRPIYPWEPSLTDEESQ